MRRTRKWAFVAQEATRLAELGLSPLEISLRLNVSRSTVTRWMAAGKLPRTAAPPLGRQSSIVAVRAGQAPADWAKDVRETYDLDATDEQLVNLAESALLLSMNQKVAAHVRLSAAGRFQALVRQLALVARAAEDEPDVPVAPKDLPKPKKNPIRAVRRRSSVDPRKLLMAVK